MREILYCLAFHLTHEQYMDEPEWRIDYYFAYQSGANKHKPKD